MHSFRAYYVWSTFSRSFSIDSELPGFLSLACSFAFISVVVLLFGCTNEEKKKNCMLYKTFYRTLRPKMENISFRNTTMLVHLFSCSFFLRIWREAKNEVQLHLVNVVIHHFWWEKSAKKKQKKQRLVKKE